MATSIAAATLVIVIITSLVFANHHLLHGLISDIYDKSRSIVHRSFPQCQRCERLRGRGKFDRDL